MNLVRRNSGRALLLLVFLLFIPRLANACGCLPKMTTVLDDFEAADLVIIVRLNRSLQPGWKIDQWLITREQTRAEWKRSNLDLPTLTKRWFMLRAKKHFGADISLVPTSRIAGRVTTPANPVHH